MGNSWVCDNKYYVNTVRIQDFINVIVDIDLINLAPKMMQDFDSKIIYQSPNSKLFYSNINQLMNGSEQRNQLVRPSNYLTNSFQSTTKYSLNSLNSIFFKNGKIYNMLSRNTQKKAVKCGCIKSFCEAKYCECFRNGQICGKECVCRGCKNTIENFNLKNKEKSNELPNPHNSVPGVGLNNGCKCKRSKCQKKYCQCFQNGKKCESSCACINCHNGKPESIIKQEIQEQNYSNPDNFELQEIESSSKFHKSKKIKKSQLSHKKKNKAKQQEDLGARSNQYIDEYIVAFESPQGISNYQQKYLNKLVDTSADDTKKGKKTIQHLEPTRTTRKKENK